MLQRLVGRWETSGASIESGWSLYAVRRVVPM